MAFVHALIPLDGSDFSRQALAATADLLEPRTTRVTLMRAAIGRHMPTPLPERPLLIDGWMALPETAPPPSYGGYDSQLEEGLRRDLEDALREDARTLERRGFTVDVRVVFGDPAEAIAACVDEDEVDLVVMATHGRSGLGRALLGSVAESVLRRADVPVLMVRPQTRAAGEPLTAMTRELAV